MEEMIFVFCRDFVDVYLKEMDDRKNEPDSMFYGARAG